MSTNVNSNTVYLILNINDKKILGIGNSIDQITDVDIPIDTALTGVEELQRQIKVATGTFTGNPVEMSIKDALASGSLTGDAGNKITNLITMLQTDADIPSEMDELKGRVDASIQAPVSGGSNKLLGGITFGKRPNTKLGTEIYEEWIKKYKVKFPMKLELVTKNINSKLKESMISYINELTEEFTMNLLPPTDESASTDGPGLLPTPPSTDGPALPPTPPSTDESASTDGPPSTGGKHTKRNKRNKHRRTKRRQSRNT